jgi:hypothetical protein
MSGYILFNPSLHIGQTSAILRRLHMTAPPAQTRIAANSAFGGESGVLQMR